MKSDRIFNIDNSFRTVNIIKHLRMVGDNGSVLVETRF